MDAAAPTGDAAGVVVAARYALETARSVRIGSKATTVTLANATIALREKGSPGTPTPSLSIVMNPRSQRRDAPGSGHS